MHCQGAEVPTCLLLRFCENPVKGTENLVGLFFFIIIIFNKCILNYRYLNIFKYLKGLFPPLGFYTERAEIGTSTGPVG